MQKISVGLKYHPCVKGGNGWFTYHKFPGSKVHAMIARIALHCKRREMDMFHSQLKKTPECLQSTVLPLFSPLPSHSSSSLSQSSFFSHSLALLIPAQTHATFILHNTWPLSHKHIKSEHDFLNNDSNTHNGS